MRSKRERAKREQWKCKRERKAIQAREDEMTNKKKKKHRRKPKFKVKSLRKT